MARSVQSSCNKNNSRGPTARGRAANRFRGPLAPGYFVFFLLIYSVFPICNASAASFSGQHPAVVRVAVAERDGAAYGSGSLVAVDDTAGLILTNWHVVRDAAGPIVVYFPDGFHSGAYLLRTDRDWDLAALAIRRPPNAQPIPISTTVPRPGDSLTIIGYGSGSYLVQTGRCTQYVSPGGNLPFEMVELSVGARNGDSGGPILNSRGELAGVLFGSAFGRTTGSYCGRLHGFVDLVAGDFRRISNQAMLAGPGTPIAKHRLPRFQPKWPAPQASGSRPWRE